MKLINDQLAQMDFGRTKCCLFDETALYRFTKGTHQLRNEGGFSPNPLLGNRLTGLTYPIVAFAILSLFLILSDIDRKLMVITRDLPKKQKPSPPGAAPISNGFLVFVIRDGVRGSTGTLLEVRK